MGTEYKRNWKNLVGRPDILGRDVWELTATALQAPSAVTALTDRAASTQYIAAASCRLEGAHVACSGTLGLGRIGVELLVQGLVVASGALLPGESSKHISLPKGALQDIPVASGEVVTANYVVEQVLDTVQAVRVALSIVHLEYPERA